MNGTENNKTEQQLVVFDLARESYGVDIGKVSEIIRMQEITKVPRTPAYVEGMINLRGKLIPVVDLRKMFGLAVEEQTKENRTVVVDIDSQSIGIIVDAVTEVLSISNDLVEPPSSVATESDYLMGIANLGERIIILLDLEKVFTREQSREMAELGVAASEKAPPVLIAATA